MSATEPSAAPPPVRVMHVRADMEHSSDIDVYAAALACFVDECDSGPAVLWRVDLVTSDELAAHGERAAGMCASFSFTEVAALGDQPAQQLVGMTLTHPHCVGAAVTVDACFHLPSGLPLSGRLVHLLLLDGTESTVLHPYGQAPEAVTATEIVDGSLLRHLRRTLGLSSTRPGEPTPDIDEIRALVRLDAAVFLLEQVVAQDPGSVPDDEDTDAVARLVEETFDVVAPLLERCGVAAADWSAALERASRAATDDVPDALLRRLLDWADAPLWAWQVSELFADRSRILDGIARLGWDHPTLAAHLRRHLPA